MTESAHGVGAWGRPHAGRELATRLRGFLDDAGFAPEGIQRLLGLTDAFRSRPTDLPVYLRRLDASTEAAATLVRLFLLGVPVSRTTAERDLAPLGLEPFVEAGLLSDDDDDVRPLVKVVPHDELLIASDFTPDDRADHVAGVHRPSSTLAHLTVSGHFERALDMGTGNGIQALQLAGRVREVVATDVNERALSFAAFNAALNGVENVELRAGSFLEPVAGERFDLVVANPPYVISPESEFLFRDSGLGRDRVSESLVRELPSVLEQGAFATVMVSWVQDGDDPSVTPRAWLEGSGCDAVILHSGVDDALASAVVWNREAVSEPEFAARLNRWADYYRDERIEALGYGALVLRRRTGANWTTSFELPAGVLAPANEHVRRLFEAQDYLADSPPLLEQRFSFAPGARMEHGFVAADDGWRGHDAALVLTEGLGFRAGLDVNTSRIVGALRPDRTLGEALDEVAGTIGAEQEAVREGGAELARRLVEHGILVPART